MKNSNNQLAYRSAFLIGLLSSSALAVSSAHAQTAQPANTTEGEIIVTAQRKDEALSKTPVAVSVLSADLLSKAQIVTEDDLRSSAPGLSVRTGRTSSSLNFALRGQSQDPYSSTRPGVMPYFNNVQTGSSGIASALYDLANVQVLKGPQGTLFGRSATGGAVLYSSVKPSNDFGGYISALGGDLGQQKYEGALNVPVIADTLLVRGAGYYQERDGYQRNLFDGRDYGDFEKVGLRGSVTLNVGKLTNEFVLDYYKADGTNVIGDIAGIFPFTGVGAPYVPVALLYGGTATPQARATGIAIGQSFLAPAGPAAQAGFPARYDAYFADPKHPNTGVAGELAAQQARGPYITNSDAKNLFKAENYIWANTTSYDITENMQIKNIFGYLDQYNETPVDYDGTPYQIYSIPMNSTDPHYQSGRVLSDELQLLGTTLNDRLSYVTGLYYANDKLKSFSSNRNFQILASPGQSAVSINDNLSFSETKAVYAQGTYKLNDSGLSATLGARWTSEEVGKYLYPDDGGRQRTATAAGLAATSEIAPAGFAWNKSETFDKLSWTVGLENQFNKNLLVYIKTRRAFKSGGFNLNLAPKNGPASIGGDSYEAEQVTDVELGSKFLGRIGDMPVRATIAVYQDWLENNQRASYTVVAGAPTSFTVNVPEAEVYGLELEGQMSPTDWLTVGGNLNYTHAEYTDGNVISGGVPQTFDRVSDTPEWSGALFGDINVPVAPGLSALFHADVYYQDDSFTGPRSVNANGTTIEAYTITNLRAGVESEKGWSIIANVKNAFEEEYYNGGFALGEIGQINVLVPGEPRTWTVEAKYKF